MAELLILKDGRRGRRVRDPLTLWRQATFLIDIVEVYL